MFDPTEIRHLLMSSATSRRREVRVRSKALVLSEGMIETMIDVYVQHELMKRGHSDHDPLYAGNVGGSTELRLRQDALVRRRLVRRYGPRRRYLMPTRTGARLVAGWQSRLGGVATT